MREDDRSQILAALAAGGRLAPIADEEGPVELILVVKGAGIQAADDTLDLFTRGFWPAVLSLEGLERTHLRERSDVFPPGHLLSAHATGSHNHVTEIEAWLTPAEARRTAEAADDGPSAAPGRPTNADRRRRVWIREIDWEVALEPDPPLEAVLREWRMASWVFFFEFYQWLASLARWLVHRLPDRAARPLGPAGNRVTLPNLVGAFTFAYLGLLLVLDTVVRATTGREHLMDLVGRLLGLDRALAALPGPLTAALARLGAVRGLDAIVFLVAIALVAALPAALRSRWWHRHLTESHDGRPPSLSNFLLLALIAALLYSPSNYLAALLLLMAWQAALLLIRAAYWNRRPLDESDIETRYAGSLAAQRRSLTGQAPPTDPPPLVPRRHPPVRFALFIYRGIVVVALPLFFVLLALAWLMKRSRVLALPGKGLESMLSVWLGGIMGDVVSYAMDPAKAARIRSTVEHELRFFNTVDAVRAIHVVAHSQGTPITFELLFRHLAADQRRKVATYLSLGSVLSYYHHANAVLDPYRFDPRFPPPRYPDPTDFDPRFRWYNCWNLADPITEFYGLDEYVLFGELAQPASPLELPPIEAADFERLSPLSPTNVKTPATRRHHSDYWTNQEWVQRPLARRILLGAPGWPEQPREPGRSHALPVFAWHALAMLAIFGVWGVAVLVWNQRTYPWLLGQLGGGLALRGELPFVGGSLAAVGAAVEALRSPAWQACRADLLALAALLVVIASLLTLPAYAIQRALRRRHATRVETSAKDA